MQHQDRASLDSKSADLWGEGGEEEEKEELSSCFQPVRLPMTSMRSGRFPGHFCPHPPQDVS